MSQNCIDSLLAIRKTREADLCLSPGVTFSLLLCSPDASLYFTKALNERWIFLAHRQPGTLQMHHTPSRRPLSKRSSAVQITLTPIPDPSRPAPPHLLSAPFSRLFFLCSCHVAERGSRHPSDHPSRSQTPTESPWKPSSAPRERHLLSSPDRAQCKWGLDGEGEDLGSGRRGGLVVLILSKPVLR